MEAEANEIGLWLLCPPSYDTSENRRQSLWGGGSYKLQGPFLFVLSVGSNAGCVYVLP